MSRRRPRRSGVGRIVTVAALAVAGGCGDDGPPDAAASATRLCPAVQAWSDAIVDIANDFRVASRELDPSGRRARYASSFEEQGVVHQALAETLTDLPLTEELRARLDHALTAVLDTVAADAAEAARLPEAAYEQRAVRDGSLVTGTEKAKAIVFNTLTDLAADPSTGIPRGCGRGVAVVVSAPVTLPP